MDTANKLTIRKVQDAEPKVAKPKKQSPSPVNTSNVLNKTVFTTGDIAKLLKVAPRTVSKWFDSGRLKGYRIPGSKDRRIPLDDFISFCKKNEMPLPKSMTPGEGTSVGNYFIAGANERLLASFSQLFDESAESLNGESESIASMWRLMMQRYHVIVLILPELNILSGQQIAECIRKTVNYNTAIIAAITPEQRSHPSYKSSLFDETMAFPFDPGNLFVRMRALAEKSM